MAKITGRMEADFQPPDVSSDVGSGSGLDEQLKKAKKEHYPDAIPVATLMPPVPRNPVEALSAARSFVHQEAPLVKADHQLGYRQHPPQSVASTAVSMQSPPVPVIQQVTLPTPMPVMQQITLPTPTPVMQQITLPTPMPVMQQITLPTPMPVIQQTALPTSVPVIPQTKSLTSLPVMQNDTPPVAQPAKHSAAHGREVSSVSRSINPQPVPTAYDLNTSAPASLHREGLASPGVETALSSHATAARPLDKSRREESSGIPSPAMPPALQSSEGGVVKNQRLAAKADPQALPAEAHVRKAKSAPAAEGQNRIRYSFSSWGNEHRVVLTTVRDSSQQLAVVMTPSDGLVSHRLQHAINTHPPLTEISLREDHDGDEQQDPHQQPPEAEEE